MNKSPILFLLHLPPPVHGSSLVGKFIQDSPTINSLFKCTYINLLASKSLNHSGGVSVYKILGFVVTWLKVFKALIFSRPKVCYFALSATGVAFIKDFALVVLLRALGIKTIFHLHNKGVQRYRKRLLHRFLYRFTFKRTKIILLSERLYSDIMPYADKSQVVICPNGIPLLDVNHKKSNGTDPLRILFFSNLFETKGVLVLLDACALLLERSIEFHCDFVGGEGDLSAEDFKRHVAARGLSQSVSYLGKKFGKEKAAIFASTDIFAFPTRFNNECFPLVLLEAMCSSLPVISTNEGGIPDLIDDGVNGYLVPQQDPVVLADRLEHLLKDPAQRQRMGDAGRKKFLESYTLEKFETRMAEILFAELSTELLIR